MSDLDTIVAALVTGGVTRAYKFGAVPASPAYPYAVVSAAPGAPQVRTLDGSGDPMGRFVVQHFSRTHDGATDLADLTFATFDGHALPLDDAPVCWQEVTSGVYRDPDDQGVLTITHTYRF